MATMKKSLALSLTAAAFVAYASLSNGMAGAPAVQDARPLYMQKCASCHGGDGAGNTAKGKELKVRDLRSAEVQKMSDAKLLEIIAKGEKKMPAYEKSLGIEKCKQLLAYTRELAKK